MTDPLIGWTTETLRFDRLLGKGGMGSVYQGVQVQMNRKVAIKVIAPHLFAEPGYRERFIREAQTLGRLVHPHIISAHDFGPVPGPDGQDLFVMVLEFVNGWSLGTLLKEKRLSVRQVLTIHAQAAEALAFAHSVGVIHRDIKPDNLMVTRKGVCKLADFGLARAEDSVQVTTTGALIGSPAYMSPESCRGDQPGPPSDVYSLGCSLFQALTDSMPYPGAQSLAVLQAHITQPIPSLVFHRPDLPRLDAVLHRILAKKAQDRPTAAEVVRILQAEAELVPESLVAGRIRANSSKSRTGAAKTEITRGVSLSSAERRWPWWLAGIAAGGLVVAAGAWGLNRQGQPAPPVVVTPPPAPALTTPGESPTPLPALEVPRPSEHRHDPVTVILDRAEQLVASPTERIRRMMEAQALIDSIPDLANGELPPEDSRRLAEIRRRINLGRKLIDERKAIQERLRAPELSAGKDSGGTVAPAPVAPVPGK